MNCRNFKKQAFIYAELTSSEKSLLEAHLQVCEGCRKTFQEANQLKVMVNPLSSHVAQVKDPEYLTYKIMKALKAGTNQAAPNTRISFFETPFLRYALSAMSMASVIFFIFELQRDVHPQTPRFESADAGNPKIILNTNLFLKATRQHRTGNETEKLTSLYYCIKGNNCDNSLVRKLKNKNQVIHETL